MEEILLLEFREEVGRECVYCKAEFYQSKHETLRCLCDKCSEAVYHYKSVILPIGDLELIICSSRVSREYISPKRDKKEKKPIREL